MNRLFNWASKFFNGSAVIDNQIKYTVICYALSFIHLGFSVLFFLLPVMFLGVYNFLITCIYFHLGCIMIPRQRYDFTFYFATFEIIFHSVMVSLVMGFEWGFMIYTFALIPVVFYLSVTFSKFTHKMIRPFIMAFVTLIAYCTTKVLCAKVGPLYANKFNSDIALIMYCVNSFIAVFMLTLFTVLFTLEIKHYQLDLYRQASVDPLTRLLNRRSMQNHLDAAMESEKDFVLIMADIDDFKKINDSYGHDCGDDVLRYVSNVISESIGEGNFVSRWGGEEFLILINSVLTDAVTIAEKIRATIAASAVQTNTRSLQVTITLGVANGLTDSSLENIIKTADDNLYKGKREGKNVVIF